MLRLILAIALLAACLALPAPSVPDLKNAPNPQFQKAFINYDNKNSGFGEGGMGMMGQMGGGMGMPGGMDGGMYGGGFGQGQGQGGFGFYPQQKRDPYHYGGHQRQDNPFFERFRGLDDINNDNVDPLDNLINDQDV